MLHAATERHPVEQTHSVDHRIKISFIAARLHAPGAAPWFTLIVIAAFPGNLHAASATQNRTDDSDASGPGLSTSFGAQDLSEGARPTNRKSRRSTDEPSGDDAQHCYRAGSSFDDPTCNCFGRLRSDRPVHAPAAGTRSAEARIAQAGKTQAGIAQVGSEAGAAPIAGAAQPTAAGALTIVVGGWLGAEVDAWLLKILIEERLGRATGISICRNVPVNSKHRIDDPQARTHKPTHTHTHTHTHTNTHTHTHTHTHT